MRNTHFSAAILLLSASAYAGTILPFRADDSLGAILTETEIPKDQLRKEIRTGYTTTLLLRARVANGKQTLSSDHAITIFYDLWDEVYRVSLMGQGQKTTQNLKSAEEVFKQLEKMSLFPIAKLDQLDPVAETSVEVTLFLDPIQKDRAQAIRKWISENAVNTGGNSKVTGQGRSNPIFTAILDEYLTDGLTSIKWKATVRSTTFRVSSLKSRSEVIVK